MYLKIYGERDGTTAFMRSLHQLPQAERIFTEDPLGKRNELIEIAVVGCSYGIEVYSYAALCETHGFAHYSVDGFDVHSDRLEVAKIGRYGLGWDTDLVLKDNRIKRGLVFKGRDKALHIKKDLKKRARFFHHDISLEPLPILYDVVVCTNVLGQEQRGGRENAMKNLMRSLKYGGLIVQNYSRFCVNDELRQRVNVDLQRKLGLTM